MSERSSKRTRIAEDASVAEEQRPDGPIEDEELAKIKLEEAGFTLDNVTDEEVVVAIDQGDGVVGSTWTVTPMIHFCGAGDLKMCRYLLSKGGSTTKSSNGGRWFPMFAAAFNGKFGTCKWLHQNGAADDVRRAGAFHGSTPVGIAVVSSSVTITRWMVLNGGLSSNNFGEIDARAINAQLLPKGTSLLRRDGRHEILSWADDAIQSHACFMIFLSGTMDTPDFSTSAFTKVMASRLRSEAVAQRIIGISSYEEQRIMWGDLHPTIQSTLRCFNGKSGILERIADFYGLPRGRDLRIYRQLVPALRRSLEETPATE